MIAGVNDDGMDDIVFACYNSGYGLQIRTKILNGDGTFAYQSKQFTDGERIWNKSAPMIADVNGDGMDDIVFT